MLLLGSETQAGIIIPAPASSCQWEVWGVMCVPFWWDGCVLPTTPFSVRWLERLLGPGGELSHEIVFGFLHMKCHPISITHIELLHEWEIYLYCIKPMRISVLTSTERLNSSPTSAFPPHGIVCVIFQALNQVFTSSPYTRWSAFLPTSFPKITSLFHMLVICWVRSPFSLIIPLSVMGNSLVF